MFVEKGTLAFWLACLLFASSCQTNKTKESNKRSGSTNNKTEKVRPAPGTSNLQGRVLFKGQPVPNNEVKLCEKHDRGSDDGCGAGFFTTQTDENGGFLFTDVPPKTYQVLLVRIFNENDYIFPTSSTQSSSPQSFYLRANETEFVDSINLFKADLKISRPEEDAEVDVSFFALQLSWNAYPEAAYYKLSLGKDFSNSPVKIRVLDTFSIYKAHRVSGTSFAVDKTLSGAYLWKVEAFDSEDHKIAESDICRFIAKNSGK